MTTRQTKKPKGKRADLGPFVRGFGSRVCDLREKAGMTQGELAEASGISRVFLGTIERAEKESGLRSVEKLAKGLGVDVRELFAFEKEAAARSPTAQLARKIEGLAARSTEAQVRKFEKIAKAFFDPE